MQPLSSFLTGPIAPATAGQGATLPPGALAANGPASQSFAALFTAFLAAPAPATPALPAVATGQPDADPPKQDTPEPEEETGEETTGQPALQPDPAPIVLPQAVPTDEPPHNIAAAQNPSRIAHRPQAMPPPAIPAGAAVPVPPFLPPAQQATKLPPPAVGQVRAASAPSGQGTSIPAALPPRAAPAPAAPALPAAPAAPPSADIAATPPPANTETVGPNTRENSAARPFHGLDLVQSPAIAPQTTAPDKRPQPSPPPPVRPDSDAFHKTTRQPAAHPIEAGSAPQPAFAPHEIPPMRAAYPAQTALPVFTHPPEVARSAAAQIAGALHKNSDGSIELALNPEELGRVRISFHTTETGLAVSVIAERGETAELMRRHVHILMQEFRDFGQGNARFSFGQQDRGGKHPPPPPHAQVVLRSADQTAPPSAANPPAITQGIDLRL